MSKLRPAVLSGLFLAAIAGPAAAADPVPIIRGTAFYDISLERAEPSSGISDLGGRMVDVVEEPSCGTYSESAQLVMELTVSTGQTLTQVAVSNYVEDADGLTFDATMSMNGTVAEASKGRAVRSQEGLRVTLEKPQADEIILPADAVFPLEMVERAIAAALAGESSLELTTYDGLGDGTTVRTTSILIGEPSTDPIEGEEGQMAAALGLGGMRHWPMTFTAFPGGQAADATPAYSISSQVFENGFAVNSVYDFRLFAMRLHLLDFKRAAAPPACADAAQ